MACSVAFEERIPRGCLEGLRFLASGGFGDVYWARHRDWRIPIAVKILNRDSCRREELLAEARAMDKARFVYILRLFGLYEEEEEAAAEEKGWGCGPRLGIVMEYMDAGSLAHLLERVRPLPWALRFRLLYQVALGMNYLHGLRPPLLHLDLKPSNVLLNWELDIRLADFGLSKFKRGTTTGKGADRAGEEDGYGGTLEYMPPESFTDLNYRPTPATDVYSYAILTWSVLTGEEPYPDLNPNCMSSMLRMHVPRRQRPSLEELETVTGVEGLEDMKGLMKRCWDNDSEERPTFKDCSNETERIASLHKAWIVPAVRQVQDMLMKMTSPPSAESSPPVSVPTPAVAESSQLHAPPPSSLGVTGQFKTLHIGEPPSTENEALPLRSMRQMEHPRGPGTPKSYSASTGPTQGAEGPANGDFASPEMTPSEFMLPGRCIHIASSKGVQIGHHNYMRVSTAQRPEEKKKKQKQKE